MGSTPEERQKILAEVEESVARTRRFEQNQRARRRAKKIWAEDNGLTLEEYECMMRSMIVSPNRPGGSHQLIRGGTQ